MYSTPKDNFQFHFHANRNLNKPLEKDTKFTPSHTHPVKTKDKFGDRTNETSKRRIIETFTTSLFPSLLSSIPGKGNKIKKRQRNEIAKEGKGKLESAGESISESTILCTYDKKNDSKTNHYTNIHLNNIDTGNDNRTFAEKINCTTLLKNNDILGKEQKSFMINSQIEEQKPNYIESTKDILDESHAIEQDSYQPLSPCNLTSSLSSLTFGSDNQENMNIEEDEFGSTKNKEVNIEEGSQTYPKSECQSKSKQSRIQCFQFDKLKSLLHFRSSSSIEEQKRKGQIKISQKQNMILLNVKEKDHILLSPENEQLAGQNILSVQQRQPNQQEVKQHFQRKEESKNDCRQEKKDRNNTETNSFDKDLTISQEVNLKRVVRESNREMDYDETSNQQHKKNVSDKDSIQINNYMKYYNKREDDDDDDDDYNDYRGDENEESDGEIDHMPIMPPLLTRDAAFYGHHPPTNIVNMQ